MAGQNVTSPNQTGFARSESISSGKIPNSINDALKMIDQALSRDGANLKELVSSEYTSFRRAIDDMAPRAAEVFRDYSSQAVGVLQDYASERVEQGRKIVGRVDKSVHENPWPVISGVALGSLAVGFLLGRGRSSEQMH
jgi:ElaB/YqjD/DUF883 family membrane-anchored ribosome-binding protein